MCNHGNIVNGSAYEYVFGAANIITEKTLKEEGSSSALVSNQSKLYVRNFEEFNGRGDCVIICTRSRQMKNNPSVWLIYHHLLASRANRQNWACVVFVVLWWRKRDWFDLIQQARDVHPMSIQCWAGVCDAGTTLYRHCVNASCLLGSDSSSDPWSLAGWLEKKPQFSLTIWAL